MPKPIVIWPEKVLTTPTRPVTGFGDALEPLLKEMEEAMREAKGIGIAANQIGVPLRVALVGREDGTFFEIVNPTILERWGKVTWQEGCLSVPDAWEQVERSGRVRVRFQDRHGTAREETADGKLAHVFQHEIDHLDGTTFVMHLSPLKRSLIRERMERLRRERERDPDGKR